MTAAYELRSDRPVQMMLAALALEAAVVAEEEAGQEEAGVVSVMAAVGQHQELKMDHCAFAKVKQSYLSASTINIYLWTLLPSPN